MIKVAIYCRLSEEDKNKVNSSDDSESIQNQKSMLINYANEKGWCLYDIYVDDDYSGIDSTRPDFNRMLKDAEARCFNVILCKTLSRFTRDMELVERYLHNKFIEWGIRFISIVDNADTENKGNKKARQIAGLINEWYLEDSSESIRAVFLNKKKTGQYIGSFPVYGYQKDPTNKNHLVIDLNTCETVRTMFNMYLNGYTTPKIALYFNNEGIPSPTKYKRDNGCTIPSNTKTELWAKDSILKMLKNQMYIGNMVQNYMRKASYKSSKWISLPPEERIIVEGTHEPIISKDVFWEVQKMISENRKTFKNNGTPHCLAGKLRCLDCGSTIYRKTYSSDPARTYFRCKLSAMIDRGCTPHSILMRDLFKMVTERVRQYLNEYVDFDSLANDIGTVTVLNQRIGSCRQELACIERGIADKTNMLRDLYTDKYKGIISEEQFVQLNETFAKEQKQLENRQRNLNTEINLLVDEELQENRKAIIIDKYKNFTELNHELVRALIDYIEVGEKNPETRKQEIRIHWLF